MPTSIDVFAKAREFDRLELLEAARRHDMLPYFRVLEGPTLPVVEMEGKHRIMLGAYALVSGILLLALAWRLHSLARSEDVASPAPPESSSTMRQRPRTS